MSIASAISRITALRDRLVTRLSAWGNSPTDLEDCVDVIEGISGTQNITSTASVDVLGNGKRYAQVNDANLIPKNIIQNVTILGVTGTAPNSPTTGVMTNVTLFYGGEYPPSVLVPPSGYDGFDRVVPELTDASPVLVPSNIKGGVTVMGVTGTYQTPTESKSPTLAELVSGGIVANAITVTPTSGKHLSQVTIPRIVKGDGTAITSSDIKSGVSILGITGSYTGGGYAYFGRNFYIEVATSFFSFASVPSVPRYLEMYLYQGSDDVTNLRVFHLSGENPNGANLFAATVHCIDSGVYTQVVVNDAIGYTGSSGSVGFDLTSLGLLKFKGYYTMKVFY